MLALSEIEKRYITEDVETTALSKVSLSIEAGEFAMVTGTSGSGKTTLLNIAGLLEPSTSGVLKIAGEEVSNMGDRSRSKMRRDLIGFIFQSFNLLPDMTVRDNVELPLRLRGIPRSIRRKRVQDALTIVGLSNRQSHYPSQLSGGQQQRVAIARAVAGDPKLIFADEPTGNLDSQMSEQIMMLLSEINDKGTTIVMVTHNEKQIEKANHRIQLMDGKVKFDSNRVAERASLNVVKGEGTYERAIG